MDWEKWKRRIDPRWDAWDAFFELLADVQHQLEQIMSAITDLQAEVAATATVEQSAITLIQGIAVQLAAAISAAGVTDPDLVALSTQLSASTSALAAAVTANTPPAPPVVVPPLVPPTPPTP